MITGVLYYVNIIYNEKLQKIADEISHMNLIQVLFGVDGEESVLQQMLTA